MQMDLFASLMEIISRHGDQGIARTMQAIGP